MRDRDNHRPSYLREVHTEAIDPEYHSLASTRVKVMTSEKQKDVLLRVCQSVDILMR